MKTEKEIVNLIIDIEKELWDEDCYLDEGQQSRLYTLYEVLDRELTLEESDRLQNEKEKTMNEYL